MKLNLFGYTISIKQELENEDIPQELKDAISIIKKYGTKSISTQKQQLAAKKATQLRVNKAKKKIENAVNILRMENQKITQSKVAKISGCSINTVRKYKTFIEQQSL